MPRVITRHHRQIRKVIRSYAVARTPSDIRAVLLCILRAHAIKYTSVDPWTHTTGIGVLDLVNVLAVSLGLL